MYVFFSSESLQGVPLEGLMLELLGKYCLERDSLPHKGAEEKGI